MKKVYRAVSSAVYGKDKASLVLSVSVVGAYAEDDIRLEETTKEPIDTSSPESVRARFDHLLATLVRTVGKQKEVYGGLSVPVVFGVPKDFKGLDLTNTLRTAYAQVLRNHPVPLSPEAIQKEKQQARLKKAPKETDQERRVRDFLSGRKGFLGRPNIKRTAPSETKPDDEAGDVWDLDKPLVEHILRQACAERQGPGGWKKPAEKYKFDMSFHPRLFQPLHHGTQEALRSEDVLERMASRVSMIRPERGAEFQAEYDKAMGGDQQALERLRAMAREEAFYTARGYAQNIKTTGSLSRFILIAPPIPPFTTRPEYNFLQWFDLRKIYGDTFAKLLGIQHPICVKAPSDPPSPAFADVAATYAFQLKRLADTGNQDGRGTVMITNRADQANTTPSPEQQTQ